MARYKAGESAGQLAPVYDCWAVTIRTIVRRNGGTIRDRSMSIAEREEVVRRWDGGQSILSIAAEMNRAARTIRTVVEAQGTRPIRAIPKGPDHASWRGGRVVRSGYVLCYVPNNDPLVGMRVSGMPYVFEHRLVMARQLGRPLTKNETVHHINGDKQDNRPENLQLRQGRHGNGQSYCCADCGSRNIIHAAI